MRAASDFCLRLGIEDPIIQAPMAGSTTPELVAAVSNAGGPGMLGATNFTPLQIKEAIAAIRELTDWPLGEDPAVQNFFPSGYSALWGIRYASLDTNAKLPLKPRHRSVISRENRHFNEATAPERVLV